MTQDPQNTEESLPITESQTNLFENAEVIESMSSASSNWTTPQAEPLEESNSGRMECQPPPRISSQEDSVEANSSRPSSRTKRKSASQPESVKRLERSRSSLRFPAEDPCDSVKMTQIFLEDEPWHSCYAKGCQEKFSRYDLLIEHASKTHPKLKPAKYPCALKSCKFTCETPRDWITHMADEHPQFVSQKETEFFDGYFLKNA